MIQINITGIDQIMRRLGAVQGTSVLRAPMQRSVLLVQGDMSKYPAAPAGSRYRRTGTLGRRWTTRVHSVQGGVVGTVGNNTTYAPFVQSHLMQARVHRGRWQTDSSVLGKRTDAIHGLFRDAIRRALGG